MDTVYLLWHNYELPQGEESVILIGVYSSHEDAQAAQGRVCDQPGFVDHPEGFLIEEMKIGEDHWKEGFGTYTCEAKE